MGITNISFTKCLAYCQVLWLIVACSEKEIEMDNSFQFIAPSNFPAPTYTLENNSVTKKGFLLGKKLFFDPVLSRDNSVSCNNCHQQAIAFADNPLHPVSIGVDNRMGSRNAPSLANLAFFSEFFWDGGVTHLDFVPINAIESHVEMDNKLADAVEKLNKHTIYPGLFKEAFQIDSITSPYLLQALSQFTLLMISANSPYDKFVRNEGHSLSDTELKGMQVFEEKCSSCHAGALFTDFSYRNNGLNSTFVDTGRALITEDTDDVGKFRVPSLRNIALTPPYMHNARFKTLREVLDHYDGQIVDSPTLDPLLQSGGIPLEEFEKDHLIAFLHTLTDLEFISDPKFRNDD